MAKKLSKKKSAPKPKKLSRAERQKRIDALQNKRDGAIIASYGRTLDALARIHGGEFADEKAKLNSELNPISLELEGLGA